MAYVVAQTQKSLSLARKNHPTAPNSTTVTISTEDTTYTDYQFRYDAHSDGAFTIDGPGFQLTADGDMGALESGKKHTITITNTSTSSGGKMWYSIYAQKTSEVIANNQPQNPIVLTASTVTITPSETTTGNTISIQLSNNNPTLVYHVIAYTFGGQTQTITLGANTSSTSISIDHALFNRTGFSDKTKGTMTIAVATMDVSTNAPIGSSYSQNVTITLSSVAASPVFQNFKMQVIRTGAPSNLSSLPNDIYQDDNMNDVALLVQSISGAKFKFTGVQPQYGAEIERLEISGGFIGKADPVNEEGQPTYYEASIPRIQSSGWKDISIKAVDSRGYSSSVPTETIPRIFVMNYREPYFTDSTIVEPTCYRCDRNKNNVIDASQNIDAGKFCYLSLPLFCNQLIYNNIAYNSLREIKIQYKEANAQDGAYDQTQAVIIPITSDTQTNPFSSILTLNSSDNEEGQPTYFLERIEDPASATAYLGFDPSKSYMLRITLTDACGNSGYKDVFLNSISYTMHFRRGGTGVAFGMLSSEDNAVQITPNWDLYVKGKAIDPDRFMPELPDTSANQFLKDTGKWASLPTMSTDVAGLVPAPTSGDSGKFLRGDGQWASPITSGAFSGKTTQDVYNCLFPISSVIQQMQKDQNGNTYRTSDLNSLAATLGVTATWTKMYTRMSISTVPADVADALYYSYYELWVRTA